MLLKRRQSSFVITGPSGVGKSAIIKRLFDLFNDISFSVSATTRKPRLNEVDGVNYFFLSQEDFLKKIENNEFAEYTKIYDNYYGTFVNCIEKNKINNDLIFDLEIQGARAIKQKYQDQVTSIFILPPNAQSQCSRLQLRNDSDQTLQQRINQLSKDIENLKEYDYIIVNDILEDSVQSLASIIKAVRLSKKSYINLDEVIKSFTS